MYVLLLYWRGVRGTAVLLAIIFSGDKRVWGYGIRGADSSVDYCRGTFFVGGWDSHFVRGVLYAFYGFGDGGVYYWIGIIDNVGR